LEIQRQNQKFGVNKPKLFRIEKLLTIFFFCQNFSAVLHV
jgi:hypothetical protein